MFLTILVIAGNSNAQESNMLSRIGNTYYYHGQPMTEKEMVEFIKQDCHQAYAFYQEKYNIEKAGWGVLGSGLGLTAIGLALGIAAGRDPSPMQTAGLAVSLIGATATIYVSIPMIIVGNVRKKEVYREYNMFCQYKEQETSQLEFRLISDSNGLGLALNF